VQDQNEEVSNNYVDQRSRPRVTKHRTSTRE